MHSDANGCSRDEGSFGHIAVTSLWLRDRARAESCSINGKAYLEDNCPELTREIGLDCAFCGQLMDSSVTHSVKMAPVLLEQPIKSEHVLTFGQISYNLEKCWNISSNVIRCVSITAQWEEPKTTRKWHEAFLTQVTWNPINGVKVTDEQDNKWRKQMAGNWSTVILWMHHCTVKNEGTCAVLLLGIWPTALG